MLESRCSEHRGDLLSVGHLPAMAGHISLSPLSPHFLLEVGRAAPRAFGSVPEPPGKGELLWERSLIPLTPLAAPLLFRPIGSACGSCSMPTKSLFSLQSLKR